jgi:hypothetical protein
MVHHHVRGDDLVEPILQVNVAPEVQQDRPVQR